MALTKDQEELYRKTMEEAKKQMDHIEEEMEEEIQKIRAKLAKLQEIKKTIRQIYEGTAKLLGVELEEEEQPEEDASQQSSASAN